MRLLIVFCLALVPSIAFANEDCETFTHEMFPPGEEVVMRDGLDWVFVDASGKRTKYLDVSGGTGVPWRGMRPADGDGESFAYRYIQEGLLIDMSIYEPYCPNE